MRERNEGVFALRRDCRSWLFQLWTLGGIMWYCRRMKLCMHACNDNNNNNNNNNNDNDTVVTKRPELWLFGGGK